MPLYGPPKQTKGQSVKPSDGRLYALSIYASGPADTLMVYDSVDSGSSCLWT